MIWVILIGAVLGAYLFVRSMKKASENRGIHHMSGILIYIFFVPTGLFAGGLLGCLLYLTIQFLFL